MKLDWTDMYKYPVLKIAISYVRPHSTDKAKVWPEVFNRLNLSGQKSRQSRDFRDQQKMNLTTVHVTLAYES